MGERKAGSLEVTGSTPVSSTIMGPSFNRRTPGWQSGDSGAIPDGSTKVLLVVGARKIGSTAERMSMEVPHGQKWVVDHRRGTSQGCGMG